MNIASGIVVFVIVWWCVFFAVLPFGVKGGWESDTDVVKGADPGAPTTPNLKRKALITTGIAAALSAIIIVFISSGVINFRE